MTPIIDMGRILRDVYEQHQNQIQQSASGKPNEPQLVGGLWAAFKFDEAAAKYKQRLEEQYGFLHILGHHRPVPLEGVFTDVYLFDRPQALRRLTIEDLEKQYRQRNIELEGLQRTDGLSLIQKERRLFILGQPGAGKTTFLKHILLKSARGELPGIPVFISLKALADKQMQLLDFIVEEMEICGFPEPRHFLQLMLRAGQMMILLDGLDEVSQAQETLLNLTQNIIDLTRQYSENHFLMTCRTAVTDYQFPRFSSVEMANFNAEQVTVFIRKWFQLDSARGDDCLSELNRPEHQGLRELARTPLLLNLLCLTYEELDHFPQRRVELYEEALNALLVKWDSSRRIRRDEVYRHLSLGRKRQMLAQIAATTFEQGKYIVSKAEIVQHILDYLKYVPEDGTSDELDGEVVLRAIEAQHGILVERARDVYGFAHLTFHEYFTAKYVVDAGERTWAGLIRHCTDAQWREVFLLTTSMLNDANEFLIQFNNYLNSLIKSEPSIVTLLKWVNEKASHSDVEEPKKRLTFQHSLYLYLALSLIRTFALEIDKNLDSALIRTQNLALALAIDPISIASLEHDIEFTHALSLARDHILVHNLDSDRTIGRTLDRSIALIFDRSLVRVLDYPLSLSLAVDCALIYSWVYGRFGLARSFLELAQQLSRTHGLTALYKALEGLTAQPNQASREEKIEFTETLWKILTLERQLAVFTLNIEQVEKLTAYLEGTVLLINCLKLAYVKERDGIMARLLQPPGSESFLFKK